MSSPKKDKYRIAELEREVRELEAKLKKKVVKKTKKKKAD